MATLYEQLGGEPAIAAVTEDFYRRVLSDERIAGFFDDVDMDRQVAKQKAFLTMVLGGPNTYTGQDMRNGHRHLVARGLNDSHVDAVLENLAAALADAGVPPAQIKQVTDLANSLRDDVLDR